MYYTEFYILSGQKLSQSKIKLLESSGSVPMPLHDDQKKVFHSSPDETVV